jgi:hypothetical protein
MPLGPTLFWVRASEDLGIELVTPFEMTFPDGSQIKAAVLVKNFGARNGMVVDPDFAVLRPHTDKLVSSGFGYSVWDPGTYDPELAIRALADWDWSGPPDGRPNWLPQNNELSETGS